MSQQDELSNYSVGVFVETSHSMVVEAANEDEAAEKARERVEAEHWPEAILDTQGIGE